MKQAFESTMLLVAIGASLLCVGCVRTFRPIAGIMHPGADRTLLIKASSWYPIVLLNVDEKSRTLHYISKDDVKDCYFISTYDYDGHLVKKTAFPKFSESCWQNFGYGAAYSGAVSPDCTSVAYLDIQRRADTSDNDLCWFDARTGGRKVLVKRLANEGNYLEILCWVSDKELLVAVDDPNKPDAHLLLIDIEKPTTLFDLHCGNLRAHQFALSHSKRYLAYWEGFGRFENRGSFKILDLHDKKEVAVTEVGEPATFAGPKWSAEDDALVYVMDNKLVRFSVLSKKSEVLNSFDPHLEIALQAWQGERLYYIVEPRDTLNPVIRLHCFDLPSNQEYPLRNHPEGPFHVFVCADGTMIYYILGQERL